MFFVEKLLMEIGRSLEKMKGRVYLDAVLDIFLYAMVRSKSIKPQLTKQKSASEVIICLQLEAILMIQYIMLIPTNK